VVAPSAFVDVQAVDVGALGNGNVIGLSKAERFVRGETILTLKDRDGKQTPVLSPCDCAVLSMGTAENSFVREGDILARLAPADAPPFIRARIDSATMMKLGPHTTVDIVFRDGGRTAFTLADHPAQPIESDGRGKDVLGIDIRVATGRDDLAVGAVGETARVVFDASPIPWLRRFLLL
jgi:hypothetical protein